MEFYKKTLGGEITLMQTFGESPLDVPEELQNRIFNSEVKAGDLCFKASDDLPGHDVTIGTHISLYLLCADKQTHEDLFNKFSDGGQVLFPIKGNFGMLKDKFGIQWMLVHKGE